jgi:glycosyltransferase involved in cell wall biosynthesis
MELSPKFSFVIPTCWKNANWGEERLDLLKCLLQSIICQTYTNWEIVLVYDGSVNGVDEIHKLKLANYLLDPRIKYYSVDLNETEGYYSVDLNENKGLSSNFARQKGSNLATGDWIIYTNDDNYFTPNLLQEIYQGITNNPDLNFVYWEMICGGYSNLHSHNQKDYGHFVPKLQYCYIDWGQYATKNSLLKRYPIRLNEYGADGFLVEDMKHELVPLFIDKVLFVHN